MVWVVFMGEGRLNGEQKRIHLQVIFFSFSFLTLTIIALEIVVTRISYPSKSPNALSTFIKRY